MCVLMWCFINRYFRKRGGLLLEKNRFLASQMLGYLGPKSQMNCADATSPWLRGARHANDMAYVRCGVQILINAGVRVISQ